MMTKNNLNRRDFLKLAGMLPLGWSASQLARTLGNGNIQQGPKNILVIVFDAFSAYRISMYGYERKTTPNIDRLAKRAIVYHNHFAGGNYTSPGTASLLTGALPWTHRAFRPNSEVAKDFVSKSIFSALPNHYSIAYTHNGWAHTLLRQFSHDIDELILPEKLMLDSPRLFQEIFQNDHDAASVGWLRAMKFTEEGQPYSLFLSHMYEAYLNNKVKDIQAMFPRGIPLAGSDSFLLTTAIDTTAEKLSSIPQPFMGYFHYLPPHEPYRTSHEFFDVFQGDGYEPPEKPLDIFGKDVGNQLVKRRREYDEYVLYCDQEFARLYDQLESSGLLDNTWLILTSDHGEMHERGIGGHMTDALYQPVVRIPLMIFEPGRETGEDVYEYTSAIDLVPTLTHLSGEKIPDWSEGTLLPPFGDPAQLRQRNIYVMRANHNDQYAPLTIASTMLVKDEYKIHYYFGYPEVPPEGVVRLFNTEADPEEMNDLAQTKPETMSELLHELQAKLKEVDEPYRS